MDMQALAQQCAKAVATALGVPEPNLGQATVAVAQVLQGATSAAEPPLGAALARAAGPARPEAVGHHERIVVSANGRNAAGIVAKLAAVISAFAGDVRDISQTIVGDYFTMLIVVDIAGATARGTHFVALRDRLREAGEALGVHVVAMHDDLLTAMHTV